MQTVPHEMLAAARVRRHEAHPRDMERAAHDLLAVGPLVARAASYRSSPDCGHYPDQRPGSHRVGWSDPSLQTANADEQRSVVGRLLSHLWLHPFRAGPTSADALSRPDDSGPDRSFGPGRIGGDTSGLFN